MGFSKIFSLMLQADAQAADEKRAQDELELKKATEARASAGEGGVLEPDAESVRDEASNQWQNDKFDARTISRVRPQNPELDIKSGYKGTSAANKFNTNQMELENSRYASLIDAPAKEASVIRTNTAHVDALNKAAQDKSLFDQNQIINSRAADLSNKRDDWALYTPQDDDIPIQDKADALSDINKYGRQGLDKGYKGAQVDQDYQEALMTNARLKPIDTTKVREPHISTTPDGITTIIDTEKGTTTRISPIKDAKTMLPSGQFKHEIVDTETGLPLTRNPSPGQHRYSLTPPAETIPVKPSGISKYLRGYQDPTAGINIYGDPNWQAPVDANNLEQVPQSGGANTVPSDIFGARNNTPVMRKKPMTLQEMLAPYMQSY